MTIRRTLCWFLGLGFLLFALRPAAAEEAEWPLDVTVPEGLITIYQPQPETFEENDIYARAAVSVLPKGQNEPVFGAIWMTARVSTDRVNRTATVLDIKVNKVRFPNSKPEQEQKLISILENHLPPMDLTISLDRLLASLETAEREKAMAEDLKNDPPKIIYSNEPAMLIFIDGKPQLVKVENADLERVVNTPYLIILEKGTKTYYLNAGELWYSAEDVMGPWQPGANPPPSVAALVPPKTDNPGDEMKLPEGTKLPKIFVSNEPAEIIATDGEPKFSVIGGTDLLYVTNTENDVFMLIGGQNYFVLLSGRWYSSSSLNGPWTYVRPDALPPDFGKIPLTSEKASVLASVPGTEQADDAIMDAQIPQTQTIKRGAADLRIEYDGKPQFEEIPGTAVQYAVNTGESVLKIDEKYYCCHEAVWYISDSPTGPWQVSDHRPKEVDSIPPSNPTYNTKYVYVYDTTPDVIIVGYTPGYVGCYPYYGTIVYGTGWYYPPYIRAYYYYPRPCTFGFGFHYNPWTGWSFGFNYHSPFFHFHVGTGGTWGWWGPARWRPPYRGPVYINRNVNININSRRVNVSHYQRNGNIYTRQGNVNRNAPARPSPYSQNKRVSPTARNDVFADRNGNVYRQTDKGWQMNQGGNKWSRDIPGASQRTSPHLDRESMARSRGATNSSRYQNYKGSPSRSGGVRRK